VDFQIRFAHNAVIDIKVPDGNAPWAKAVKLLNESQLHPASATIKSDQKQIKLTSFGGALARTMMLAHLSDIT
jgi:hypothetical protein